MIHGSKTGYQLRSRVTEVLRRSFFHADAPLCRKVQPIGSLPIRLRVKTKTMAARCRGYISAAAYRSMEGVQDTMMLFHFHIRPTGQYMTRAARTHSSAGSCKKGEGEFGTQSHQLANQEAKEFTIPGGITLERVPARHVVFIKVHRPPVERNTGEAGGNYLACVDSVYSPRPF